MEEVKRIPYGVSNFVEVVEQNQYYVDKTMYLPLLEKQPSNLFFIRPRRFGKSIFLSMLRTYYDIAQKEKFEKRFSNLWIGSRPTQLQGTFQILFLDFSRVGGLDRTLAENFDDYCCGGLDDFASIYEPYYYPGFEEEMKAQYGTTNKLNFLDRKARNNGSKLYLIVDEYDNFTNVVLNEQGDKVYHALTHASGFYREIFKKFKGMFERIFMTGVSPVTLDDLTSGFNIGWNISTDHQFNMMLGFSETDVREMIQYYKDAGQLPGNTNIDAMIEEMRPWYDNYCFARTSLDNDRVFNCDMTLYYLRNQIDFHRPPENMVDKNIRTDYSKLKMLARIDHDNTHEGSRMSTIEEIAAKGEILVDLHTSFPSEKIADIENFRSLLYYYGLLTMCGTRGDRLKMCIPNNCVREQYLGFLRDYYQQAHTLNLSHLKDLIDDFAFDGHWQPFFETIARAYRENSSIRDAIEGERNLQGFLKAYLAIASYYLVQPELEMNYGYCDFFLLPDKMRYSDIEHSYILELKYATRTATNAELEAQAEEGRQQLLRYSKDKVVQKLATGTTLHLLLIQFQGWDMVKCEEINASAIHPSE
mgnify:CR=1 FL=1